MLGWGLSVYRAWDELIISGTSTTGKGPLLPASGGRLTLPEQASRSYGDGGGQLPQKKVSQ